MIQFSTGIIFLVSLSSVESVKPICPQRRRAYPAQLPDIHPNFARVNHAGEIYSYQYRDTEPLIVDDYFLGMKEIGGLRIYPVDRNNFNNVYDLTTYRFVEISPTQRNLLLTGNPIRPHVPRNFASSSG